MDDVRAVEVLTRVRNMGWEGREITDALDHAIATIERVAGAPTATVQMLGNLILSDVDSACIRLVGQRVRPLPDPQPDGQEGLP